MRLLPISQCKPGMRLAKNIFNEEGIVLLSVHAELTERILARLAGHGIDYLYIDDPRTEDIVIADPISDQTRIQAMKTIRGTFRQLMESQHRKKTVGYPQMGKQFREIMTLIMDDLSRHEQAMVMLTNMQITDHYLYQHSLNVCIYSTILGLAHGYGREELMILGMGALLHDIGKTQIPLDILRKPGKLTDDEFASMKRHTEFGFAMLKDEPNVSLLAAHCALQHHERLDGSGYPRGLKGDDIHEYARWIGLVDSYDAMTTHRVYRSAMLPHQAMEIIYGGTGTLYDKKKIETFRDKIAIYPLGATVTLNSGETGVVVDMNASSPQRPIVRLLEDANGAALREPYEVDLSKKLTVMISAVGEQKVDSY